MAATTQSINDRLRFESAIRALEAEIANAGAHLTIDSATRAAYHRMIREMASDLRAQAASGRITWAQAAEQANETRNLVMNVVRGRSTPVGRAIAEGMKRQGRTLNEIIAKKTRQLHGNGADFNRLTEAQQSRVYAEVVNSAGKSDPATTRRMRTLSHAGRSLIVFSIALSAYMIVAAEDKVEAAGREAAITGSGIAGGLAGGALAGLACGPGAPVCVTLGAFAGGALAAFGVSVSW